MFLCRVKNLWPQSKCGPLAFLYIKLYWNIGMIIYLCVTWGYFCIPNRYLVLSKMYFETFDLCQKILDIQFSSVQLLSHVWLLVTPWTAACQASLSITNSQSFLKLTPLSQWCHPTISSSVISFSSCLQSFQHQGLFQWVSSSHQVAKVLEFQL